MKPYLMVLLVVSLAGCSTQWEGEGTKGSLTVVKPIVVAPPSQRQNGNTGDMIISGVKIAEQKVISVDVPISITGQNARKAVGAVNVKSIPYTITVKAGPALLEKSDLQYNYYKSNHRLKVDYANRYSFSGGVAIKHTGGGPEAKVYWYPERGSGRVLTATPAEPVHYTDQGVIRTPVAFDGFSQTITYLGMSGGQLKFSYKEFSGTMVRDAYTQEFSYDYKPNGEYRYKNAVFVVHKATAGTIDYTILKSFVD
ncbi:hypothetical protein [Gilvimarinus polysaccharolyticus]|uniref:hypothetical protein n=1 Tax=Gilvimarinus polysaccharolyticus TaxID=863921 RepID=UPI0012F7AB00|nr:hypothetical protein [Gilvimarinus polysaccharolyticus]